MTRIFRLPGMQVLLPIQPGAYILLKHGEVIYTGKAKNLRNRISDHLTKEDNLGLLRSGWDELYYVETNTEHNAILIEAELFAQYKPVYNQINPPGVSLLSELFFKKK